MPNQIKQDRRQFIRTAAMSLATAQLTMTGGASARSGQSLPISKPGTNTSFSSLKQINAGVLNVGYAEAGPAER